jgi:UDP-glucose 4-epimerase
VFDANVIDAKAAANKIQKVILLGTDKAAYPINAMGISKALDGKKVAIAARNTTDTIVIWTRYGNNVME